MAEDYRVGDGHVTDLRCVIVNMKYFFFESKKNLLKLLNRFCEKHFYCACGICIDQGHKQRQKLLTKNNKKEINKNKCGPSFEEH